MGNILSQRNTQAMRKVLDRLEDLKLDTVILHKYAEEAKRCGDVEYYEQVQKGLRENTLALNMTRTVLKEMKTHFREQSNVKARY